MLKTPIKHDKNIWKHALNTVLDEWLCFKSTYYMYFIKCNLICNVRNVWNRAVLVKQSCRIKKSGVLFYLVYRCIHLFVIYLLCFCLFFQMKCSLIYWKTNKWPAVQVIIVSNNLHQLFLLQLQISLFVMNLNTPIFRRMT